MKILNTLTGGYRRVMDRLLGLQTEMLVMGNAPFASLGYDLVLQGCAVTDNGNGTVNIAAGLMYVGGQTLRFDGADNVANNGSMAIVTGGAVNTDSSIFADGSPKFLYSEQKAIVGVQDSLNPFQMKITTSLYDLQQYIKDQINAAEVKGTVKTIYDFDGTFRANFNTFGLGITPAWNNWALDTGNFGTPGSAGMVVVGVGTYTDPLTGLQTIYNNGDKGGERLHKLSVAEAPIPGGIPPGVDGPHPKPGDGGGQPLYYVTGPLKAATPAANAHNNEMQYIAYYRVIKIA